MNTATGRTFTDIDRRIYGLRELIRRRSREQEELARVELGRAEALADEIRDMEGDVGQALEKPVEGGSLRELLRGLLESVTSALEVYGKSRDVVEMLPGGAATLDGFIAAATRFN